ncbi:MAG: hypothetical protein JWN76_112 [Chitinophagaceae bacterium]|nr:hypothetical protein [Chitinophagaceae bacterium]
MKKILLFLLIVTSCFTVQAQKKWNRGYGYAGPVIVINTPRSYPVWTQRSRPVIWAPTRSYPVVWSETRGRKLGHYKKFKKHHDDDDYYYDRRRVYVY